MVNMFRFVSLIKTSVSLSSDCSSPAGTLQQEEEVESGRDDDSSVFRAHSESGGPFTALRWSTRCFAMECVCRIIAQCETADSAHFDMTLAQERRLQESTGGNSDLQT